MKKKKRKKMRLTSRGQLISVGLRGGGTPLPPPPRISARIIRGLACRPLLFSSPIFSLSFSPPFSSAFFEIRGQFGPNTGHGLYRRLCLHTNEAFASRTTIDLSTIFFPSRFDNVSSFADESFPPEINNTGGLNRVLDTREGNWIRVFPLTGREMDVRSILLPHRDCYIQISIELVQAPRNLALL